MTREMAAPATGVACLPHAAGAAVFRFAYYRAAARAAGVPAFWIEDAAQDIAIAAWRDGDTPTIIGREAIDCARRYGPYTRRGHARPVYVALEAAHGCIADEPWRDDWRELVAAVPLLTAKQKRALGRRLRERPMSSLLSQHATAARRRLRAALAA